MLRGLARFRFSQGGLAATALAVSLALGSAVAHADAYPDKPIRLVVPYAAGGAVDIVARAVGQHMSQVLRQPIVVDNKPGASTNIGLDYVAKAPADGYTIMMASNSLATNGALFAKLNFNPAADFAPVARVGEASLVVVVPAKSAITSLKGLVAQARAQPGKLNYASAGNGSSGHLAGELLKDAAGIDVLHVPYKGGAPAITDLIGERITFMPINPLEVVSHIKAGTLRPLAVASASRSALLPNVPTSKEEGLPNFTASVWWGLVAPAKTPVPVIRQLNTAANAALADPEVRKQLNQLGVTIVSGTPEQFGQFVKAETATWQHVIRKAGITAD
ncbi:Bug family tripartite tricarboxylate transporter substrate binding protein [Cupriavidus agavae]|uniref:Tripartite-type tricarboxylate transporter receptor subunit TctC n=1 Tax=Cupriavidus agavae TaxID=1001822 RepID=A0A4Q7S2I5_9BURK|nr:tripartite tricarboxylate transporter substrate binding protein [Cupriavidus agavae]RZT39430.1 tripartite-type tricarboxylate transporter receptor subunit TctC [Cupriavidus agavae]